VILSLHHGGKEVFSGFLSMRSVFSVVTKTAVTLSKAAIVTSHNGKELPEVSG
jgi:hypothetical protein